LALSASALAWTGCAFISSAPPTSTIQAPNPLTCNRGLHAETPANDMFTRSAATPEQCDRWPVGHDVYDLTVTADQICLNLSQAQALKADHFPNVSNTDPMQVSIAADGGAPQQIDMSPVEGAEKVSRCDLQGNGALAGSYGMWSIPFHGCVPNHGLITASTREVSLADDVVVFQLGGTSAPAAGGTTNASRDRSVAETQAP
jgi:hypothetical protein